MIAIHHLPNVITCARIALVPALVWLLLHGNYVDALWLLLLMGLTDAIDGFLARWFDWTSTLGAYLDPLADKAMLMAAYITFGWLHWLSPWLVTLVLCRDLVLLCGAVAYHLKTRRLEMCPSAVSKVNTFFQILLAVVLVGAQIWHLPAWLLQTLIVMMVVTTIASGVSYVLEWSRRAAQQLHA